MRNEETLCVPTDLLERLPKTRRLATLRNALQPQPTGVPRRFALRALVEVLS